MPAGGFALASAKTGRFSPPDEDDTCKVTSSSSVQFSIKRPGFQGANSHLQVRISGDSRRRMKMPPARWHFYWILPSSTAEALEHGIEGEGSARRNILTVHSRSRTFGRIIAAKSTASHLRKTHPHPVPFLTTPADAFGIDDASTSPTTTFIFHATLHQVSVRQGRMLVACFCRRSTANTLAMLQKNGNH